MTAGRVGPAGSQQGGASLSCTFWFQAHSGELPGPEDPEANEGRGRPCLGPRHPTSGASPKGVTLPVGQLTQQWALWEAQAWQPRSGAGLGQTLLCVEARQMAWEMVMMIMIRMTVFY